MRGSQIGADGEFENGFLQETVNNLDTFSKGLIESTNSLYAQSATTAMHSNPLGFSDTESLLSTGENFKAGTFEVVAYDIDGNEVARRKIVIDIATSIGDTSTTNSIIGKMSAAQDDNSDNNALNDINNILNTSFSSSNILDITMNQSFADQGYTFAIEDKGTNFAGVTGLSRFFDGNNGKNITLNSDIKDDSSQLRAFKSPANGDNQTALDMVELQFASVSFTSGITTSNETLYSYFDSLVSKVGTKTNSAILSNNSITAQMNAVKQEYDSIGKVSLDEEMANLIRYQTSYGAAAKVITTIDQMMTTLLGIKA